MMITRSEWCTCLYTVRLNRKCMHGYRWYIPICVRTCTHTHTNIYIYFCVGVQVSRAGGCACVNDVRSHSSRLLRVLHFARLCCARHVYSFVPRCTATVGSRSRGKHHRCVSGTSGLQLHGSVHPADRHPP